MFSITTRRIERRQLQSAINVELRLYPVVEYLAVSQPHSPLAFYEMAASLYRYSATVAHTAISNQYES